MKKILIIIVILILIALGVYFITKDTSETVDMTETITTEEPQVTEPTQEETDDTKTKSTSPFATWAGRCR